MQHPELVGGGLVILVALVIQLIAVVRWRKNIRTYGQGTPQRIQGKKQNSFLLAHGTVLMGAVVPLMEHASFFRALDNVHARAVQTGACLLCLATLFAMLWAVSDAFCNRDYSLTAEQMEKATKSNRMMRMLTILCSLVGLACIIYALFAPNGPILQLLHPRRLSFGIVVFALGIILVVVLRTYGGDSSSRAKGKKVVIPRKWSITMLVIGFWVVGLIFAVLSFIP